METATIVASITSLAKAANLMANHSELENAVRVATIGIKLVEEARATMRLTSEQSAALNTSRELFEAAVVAHARRTAGALG